MTESQGEESIDYGSLGEDFVERICRFAFIEDFLFRRPKYFRGKQEKELCDILGLIERDCILIEVKSANRKIHQAWNVSERAQWANKAGSQARRQLRGALAAMTKQLIPFVENPFLGRVGVQSRVFTQFYAIAVIDRDTTSEIAQHPAIHVGSTRCPVIELSFHEFSHVLHETASFPDLVDYLSCRQQLIDRKLIYYGSELDLLAAYKIQYPKIAESLRIGSKLALSSDVWNKYVAMESRRRRDRERTSSLIVDRIIRDMREGVRVQADTTEVEPRASGVPADVDAHFVASQLNGLRRIERVDMSTRLIEKSKLCESTGSGRKFAYLAHNGWLYVWYVSNEKRPVRRRALTNVTQLAQFRCSARKAIGIAMNSFTRPDISMSIDSVLSVFAEDFDWNEVHQSDRELADEVFDAPRRGISTEYGKNSGRVGKQGKFKKRPRRSR